jgi:hypothetical protein
VQQLETKQLSEEGKGYLRPQRLLPVACQVLVDSGRFEDVTESTLCPGSSPGSCRVTPPQLAISTPSPLPRGLPLQTVSPLLLAGLINRAPLPGLWLWRALAETLAPPPVRVREHEPCDRSLRSTHFLPAPSASREVQSVEPLAGAAVGCDGLAASGCAENVYRRVTRSQTIWMAVAQIDGEQQEGERKAADTRAWGRYNLRSRRK